MIDFKICYFINVYCLEFCDYYYYYVLICHFESLDLANELPYFLFVTSLRCSRDIAMFACLGDKRACTYRSNFNNSPFGTKGDFGCVESPSLTHSVDICNPSFSSCKLSAVVLRLDSSSLVHNHYSKFHSLAQVLIKG